MEWTDEGIILGTRRHGETSAVAEVMTRAHGRHLGLVRGGRSPRLAPLLQPGNAVQLTWRARLDEHLGNYAIEATELHAARFMENRAAIFALTHLAGLVRLLPERDVHEGVYEALCVIMRHLDETALAGPLTVRFEVAMLGELGFGLDLTSCAATGNEADLTHVSPKTGRAVSRVAAMPWADRLMQLPAFLTRDDIAHVPRDELLQGFAMTGFFLRRHVYEPRGLGEPEARGAFVAALERQAERLAASAGG
ncbi:MAG: DNA repair protein RecO [Bosea sp. (in: a-proteobacteria)]